MICINVTDPVSALGSPSRKIQFKYLLQVISESYSSYLGIVNNSPENQKYLPLVLMTIKLAISRSRSAFTSFDQNVLFKIVDNNLEQTIASLKICNISDEKVQKLLEEVNGGLKELIENIG